MSALTAVLDAWTTLGPPAEDEAAEISIVFNTAQTQASVQAALAAAAGPHRVEARPAFLGELAEETGHRFWIATFPDLTARRAEDYAFEAARLLRLALALQSARPVLIDSLVGAAMVGQDEQLEGVLDCSSNEEGPAEKGWAPRSLGVLEAWKTTRGEGVTIASIDTGYSDHVELDGVLSDKPHLNLVEGGSDASDRFSTNVLLANPGHGTLVASVVASRGDIGQDANTSGPGLVTGSAPAAKILPIRAIRSVVDLRQSRIPAAIEHAIATGCDVIVMALGSAFSIEPVEVALRAATKRGMLVICAAGNCVGMVVFPARLSTQGLTACIAAVDYRYAPWERTSKGDAVTVSAFGEAVWGARKNSANAPNNVVKPSEGTTLATSLTAGIAALWVAAHGRANLQAAAAAAGTTVQKMFNQLLRSTAHKPSGWPSNMGAGLVNAGKLLAEPLPAAYETVPETPVATNEVTPLRRYLGPAAGEIDPLAGLEAAGLDEDLAAETLWRLYHGTAARRAEASGMLEASLEGVGGPADLPTALASRPHLSALLR